MMVPALIFEEVSKRYAVRGAAARVALDQLNMTVAPGEIVGFLGPNGAGKTTALHLALGFLQPTSGRGTIFGKPFGDAGVRSKVGFVSDQPVFFPGSASDALKRAIIFSGAVVSGARMREVLLLVGLAGARGDVRKFSRGMQQRLALAQALVHKPQLLLLDEPISALDPENTIMVLDLLQQLRDNGTAVLLSSHQLEAVGAIADRLVLLNEGRILLSGRTAELLHSSDEFELTFDALPQAPDLPGRIIYSAHGTTVLRCSSRDQRMAIQTAWSRGARLLKAAPVAETLTELFLRETRSLKEGDV